MMTLITVIACMWFLNVAPQNESSLTWTMIRGDSIETSSVHSKRDIKLKSVDMKMCVLRINKKIRIVERMHTLYIWLLEKSRIGPWKHIIVNIDVGKKYIS